MEGGRIIFRQGASGERQEKIYNELFNQDILSTRYIENPCLYSLGIQNSVHYLLDNLGLLNLFEWMDSTYPGQTREFLSSLIYKVKPNTINFVGTVNFRMFNVGYEYTTNRIEELVHFPYREGVLCDAPLDTEWAIHTMNFWTEITGTTTDSFEGNLAPEIHNPTIRVFC